MYLIFCVFDVSGGRTVIRPDVLKPSRLASIHQHIMSGTQEASSTSSRVSIAVNISLYICQSSDRITFKSLIELAVQVF